MTTRSLLSSRQSEETPLRMMPVERMRQLLREIAPSCGFIVRCDPDNPGLELHDLDRIAQDLGDMTPRGLVRLIAQYGPEEDRTPEFTADYDPFRSMVT